MSGGISGQSVTGISPVSSSVYDVTVNTGSGNGTLRLDVVIPGATLTDVAGNAMTASFNTGQTYILDHTSPTVALTSAADGVQVNALFSVTATFSENVSNLLLGDISVSNGTASNLAGGPAIYTFDVTPTAQGAVTVQIPQNSANDPAGNNNSDSNVINTTFDSIVPTVSVRNPTAGATVASLPNVGVTFSESVTGVAAGDLTVNGSAATSISGSGNGPYTFNGYSVPADGTVNIVLGSGLIKDLANNSFAGDSWSYTKNSAALTVTLTNPTVANGDSTNVSPITFTATFTEAVQNFISTDVTCTGGTVGNFAGSNAVYTFDVTPSGQGLINVSIAASVADSIPVPGKLNQASSVYVYTYDTVSPSVTLTPSGGAVPFTNAPFSVSVAFSEPTTNFINTDVSLTNASLSNFNGSGAGYSFDVTPSAQGAVSIVVNAAQATDSAGNPNTVSNTINTTFDSVAPTVVSSIRVNPSPTSASSVDYTVTFSEGVSGVGIPDYDVAMVGLAGASVTNNSGAAFTTTRTVTVNTGSGSGTLRLDVLDDDSIVDQAGNPLGGGGGGNGDFTGGQVYTLDRTAPVVASINPIDFGVVNITFTDTSGMGAGVTTAANYTISGAGKGTLANNPTSVSFISGTTYQLTWSTGASVFGQPITITVSTSVFDAVGNAIVASSGDSAGGTAVPVELSAFSTE